MGESESETAKRNAGANLPLGIRVETSALPLWPRHYSEETRQLQLLVETTERFLSEQFKQFTEDLAAETKDMSEEVTFETHEFASAHCSSLEHDLPRILRYALFVHACSLFESTLQGIADCLCRERKLPLSPSDLNGKGIHQAKNYFAKVAQVPFPDTENCWRDITTVSEIRNIVVHRNGFLMDDRNGNIQAFMRNHATCLDKDEAGRFRFTREFVPLVLARHKEFLEALFKGCGR